MMMMMIMMMMILMDQSILSYLLQERSYYAFIHSKHEYVCIKN